MEIRWHLHIERDRFITQYIATHSLMSHEFELSIFFGSVSQLDIVDTYVFELLLLMLIHDTIYSFWEKPGHDFTKLKPQITTLWILWHHWSQQGILYMENTSSIW